ncbi:hypothetical protein FB451DRAFT_1529779 [Mycena latifolia]|nr:hypothetical protein FB451DRAFT_1529779 [Mycena latifolia]
MFFIKIDEHDLEMFKFIWLSQSNQYLGCNILGDTQRCGLIDTLFCIISFNGGFESLLRVDGTVQEAHIFACPIEIISRGARISIEFPESNQFYWSLDESGSTRLSQDECDNLGIPRLKFEYKCAASFWEPYHYNAIREFHQAKGFDPYGGDVTRHLGLHVLEQELDSDPKSDGSG